MLKMLMLVTIDTDDNDYDNHDDDDNNLSEGGTLSLPPYRPAESSKHHSSPDHQQNSAFNHKLCINIKLLSMSMSYHVNHIASCMTNHDNQEFILTSSTFFLFSLSLSIFLSINS